MQNDRFVRMYGPILDVLREMGGQGATSEVKRIVADRVVPAGPERDRMLESLGNAIESEVASARTNLGLLGLLDGNVTGVWKLTEKGWRTHLSLEDSRRLGRNRDLLRLPQRKVSVTAIDESEAELDSPPDSPESSELTLIEVLRALPPSGFERLCQRILRSAGFAEVEVTGRSGDGGIDGHGLLLVNELVSFRVLFQCKRYQGSVGTGEIRNFRGAMTGRTDKGIFLTTGNFSADARREALRDGVHSIELVDADQLVALMERLGIGVCPRTVYDVDHDFFVPFQNP